MNRILKIHGALILAFLFLLNAQPAEATENLSDVTNSLMCTCGCSMVLYSCQCGTADNMKSDIQQRIDNGQSKDQILDNYVDRYGEVILAAPPKEGFNLSAWVLPFIAIGGAAFLIFVLLKRWSAQGAETEARWAQEEIKEEDLQELERELSKFED